MNKTKGSLKQNGVHLQEHEYKTVQLLLEAGISIELIPPVQDKGARTPDLYLHGNAWEMKSPTGDSKNTIRHTIKNAAQQSENIIVDLRRCKMLEEKAVKELEYHFRLSKRLRQMKVINKKEEILDFQK